MVQLAAPKNRRRTLNAVRAASFGPRCSIYPSTSDMLLGSDEVKVSFLGLLWTGVVKHTKKLTHPGISVLSFSLTVDFFRYNLTLI